MISSILKAGYTSLDAGCCLGQHLRKRLYGDALASRALYGIDLEAAFSTWARSSVLINNV